MDQDYERFLQAYPDSERKHLEGPLLTAWISMMEQPAREKTFEKAIAQLKPPARKAAMALLKRTPRSLKSALFRKIFEPIVRGTEVSAYGNLLFALSQPSPEQMTEIGELVGGGRLAKVQVTLAYGSHDEMAPPESFEELKALVPHAEREILDGMVHGAPISIPWHAKTALKNLIDRIDGHPAKFKKHRDWKARLRLIRKVQSRKGLRQAARLATPKLKVQAKKVKNR